MELQQCCYVYHHRLLTWMSRGIWRGRIGRSSCIGHRFCATSCTPGRDISVSLIDLISFVIVSIIIIVNTIFVVAVLLWIILTILILITMSSTSLVM